jgi:hypothetical protein
MYGREKNKKLGNVHLFIQSVRWFGGLHARETLEIQYVFFAPQRGVENCAHEFREGTYLPQGGPIQLSFPIKYFRSQVDRSNEVGNYFGDDYLKFNCCSGSYLQVNK